MRNVLRSMSESCPHVGQRGFCAGDGVWAGSGGGCEGGRGGKVEMLGKVIAVLQFGHGAVTPIWAGVADRC
jgi:hypothetical protein